ncbi:MAG: hypothetical protein KF830_15805 [Planctomycetes bacterium]|nr:hypothetical protein [Planctomycetota bacterium]
MRSLAGVCLFSVIGVGLPSQTTHLVGPGGLPQIRDALAVAAHGDTILVQPGTYAHFACSLAVTIRATAPGSVVVALNGAFPPPICASTFCAPTQGPTVFALPSAATAHVVGLVFEPTVGLQLGTYHHVVVTGGRVTFDGCRLEASNRNALSVYDAAVHLQNCVVRNFNGFGHALYGLRAHVTATDVWFLGGSAVLSSQHDGVQLHDSRFVGSNLLVQGGSSILGGPGRALHASHSEVWIADSSLGAGDCAVYAYSTTGRIDRSTLSLAAGCAGQLPNGPVVGVERLLIPSNGQPLTMLVRTEPNALVAIHAAQQLGTTSAPGLLEQPFALDLSSLFLAGVYLADANGEVTASWNLPPAQFVGTPLWLEAIALLPNLPIQVGPVVGGIIR